MVRPRARRQTAGERTTSFTFPIGEAHHMKNSTKDRMQGKAHEVKGAVKEKLGKMSNDPDMEDEGTLEKVGGKIQNGVGKIEKAMDD
jgi:uncharacterized protein YjbJ (UPF0337 family)